MSAVINDGGYSTNNILCRSLNGICTGALAGYLFSLISPVGGAIFGGTSAVTEAITNDLLNAAFPNNNSAVIKIVKIALPLIAGMGAAALVTSLSGFPLTFGATLLVTGSILVTGWLITATVAAVGLCCLGSAALANSSGFLPRRTM